jgi:protein-arginine kinase activator protein McsA
MSEQTDKQPGLKCEYCNKTVQTLLRSSFLGDVLLICKECYDLIEKNKNKRYSKVMDKYALLGSGYHLNRKIARLNG